MDRLPRRPGMNPVLLIYMASARGEIVLSKLAPDAKPLNFSPLVAPLISICQVIRALKVTIARCTAKARPTKKIRFKDLPTILITDENLFTTKRLHEHNRLETSYFG